jgi:cytidylate kinase
VIAIDGPSASGKGTVARGVAQALGFRFLDSGALYRLVALAALQAGVDDGDPAGLERIARDLDVRFEGDTLRLAGRVVTDAIRGEEVSVAASRVAALPEVRAALLGRQRDFRRPPGLVADGRDMGSAVFPDAVLKVFLTASPEERASRRHKQLMEKGIDATLATLLQDHATPNAASHRWCAARMHGSSIPPASPPIRRSSGCCAGIGKRATNRTDRPIRGAEAPLAPGHLINRPHLPDGFFAGSNVC